MDKALIPVFSGQLAGVPVQLCNARELHSFLQIRRDFTNWIKARIAKYEFQEGTDYLFAKIGENLPQGGRPGSDYHLTLDMAKELAMVENNEQGRMARRYFIECERKVQQAQLQPKFKVKERLEEPRILPPVSGPVRERTLVTFEDGVPVAFERLPETAVVVDAKWLEACFVGVSEFLGCARKSVEEARRGNGRLG